jgi:hypothetical protein
MTQRRTLTPKEVGKIYGLNPLTLANLRCQRRGPRYYRIGRKIVYKVADIESYLFAHPVHTLDSAEEG